MNAAENYEYDWIWRDVWKPMTFNRLYREGVEVCSPELYLRWLTVQVSFQRMYMCGFFRDFESPRTDIGTKLFFERVARQAFVRAYLFERRAGLPPRVAGPPPGSDECIKEAHASVERVALRAMWKREYLEQEERDRREVQRGQAFAAIWAAIGCLMEST